MPEDRVNPRLAALDTDDEDNDSPGNMAFAVLNHALEVSGDA